MTPKHGLHFTHKRFLEGDYSGKPLECKITKVTRSTVYFRPYYGIHEDGSEWLGNPWYVTLEKFDSIVKND